MTENQVSETSIERRENNHGVIELQECLFVLTGLRATDNKNLKDAIDMLEQRIVSVKEKLDRRK